MTARPEQATAAAPAGIPPDVAVELAKEAVRLSIGGNAVRLDATCEFPAENFETLGKLGLMGLYVPKRLGGLEASHQAFVKVAGVLGQACPSTAMLYVMHHNQYIMLVEHGSEQQKQAFLPNVAKGLSFIASGTTEPGTGGNADQCVSGRRLDGDAFVISAVKPVVSGANRADWVIITTRRSLDAPGDQLSMMVMPGRKDPSVEGFGEWDCVGMRATCSTGLRFVETRVPQWHQIGPDDASAVRRTSMGPVAAAGFSAVWLGIAESAYQAAVAHLTQRTHQFIRGERREGDAPQATRNVSFTLGHYESVQRQVAEMRTQIESARALLEASARQMDALKPGPEAPIPLDRLGELQELLWSARIACGEAAVNVCRVGLRVCGVAGMRRGGLPLERLMRDALTSQVMAPSEDLTKLLLGRKVLGVLPG